MSKQRLSRKFWNPIVKNLSPYTPGEQPLNNDYIKLNTNENPTGPSPQVKAAIIATLKNKGSVLRLYPEAENENLKKSIAQSLNIGVNQIFIGNGSDEVLAFCFQALFAGRGTLALPEITYSFYPSLARLFEIEMKLIALANDFTFNLNDLGSNIKSVIFANPNATTGIAMKKKYIQDFLIKNPNLLTIVDEAYVDFGAQTCVPLVKKFKNILVTQTFSKSRGLAGMRLGFAVGDINLIAALNRVKNSFNTYPVDRLASAAGIASLNDKEWFNLNKKMIIENRQFLIEKLSSLGFKVLPSCGNFVLTSHLQINAVKIFKHLKENKILVRYFENSKIKNWIRISIGTKKECITLLKNLESIVNKL